MSEHTPGPWKVLKHSTIVRASDGLAVVDTYRDFRMSLEYEANARLIAAAPETVAERDRLKALCGELLDALRKSNWALSTLADCTDDNRMSQRTFECLLGKNNDAIAKAEGEANE